MVVALRALAPNQPLSNWFEQIIRECTGKSFQLEHNQALAARDGADSRSVLSRADHAGTRRTLRTGTGGAPANATLGLGRRAVFVQAALKPEAVGILRTTAGTDCAMRRGSEPYETETRHLYFVPVQPGYPTTGTRPVRTRNPHRPSMARRNGSGGSRAGPRDPAPRVSPGTRCGARRSGHA